MKLKKGKYKYPTKGVGKIMSVTLVVGRGLRRQLSIVDCLLIARLREINGEPSEPMHVALSVDGEIRVWPKPDKNYRLNVVYFPKARKM